MWTFQDSVEYHCQGIRSISPGLNIQCLECTENYYYDGKTLSEYSLEELEELQRKGKLLDEGAFSHSYCDSCGTPLSGNRYYAHGFNNKREIVHLDICEDCVMYFANGDIPESWE